MRTPRWDAQGEAMRDLPLLGLKDSTRATLASALRGLNSNSHRFPWGGTNTYPRGFQSGALVLSRGCIRLDGIAVAHDGPNSRGASESEWLDSPGMAEFHLGGCGCCPLGHGKSSCFAHVASS